MAYSYGGFCGPISAAGEGFSTCGAAREAGTQVISTPVEFTPSEGASRPLGRYKYNNDAATCSMLFDEELGEAYEFFGLEQVSTPFDTARFQPKEGEDILKSVTECRFRVRLRSSS